jgi:hypothetical protein
MTAQFPATSVSPVDLPEGDHTAAFGREHDDIGWRLRRGPRPRASARAGRARSTGWLWQISEAAARQQEGIKSPDALRRAPT